MIADELFKSKLLDLASCLSLREGSQPESEHRTKTYHRHLSSLDRDDFVEACDRIIVEDDWFPTIARIRTVAAECRADRNRQRRAVHGDVRQTAPEVCPYCHGSRFVRTGGYDPLKMHAGDPGSRVIACPGCTMDGRYDVYTERRTIADEGGVPNPNFDKFIDMTTVTWPARMQALRDPETGRMDMDAYYRLSRSLRGLDPNVDERPQAVSGFASVGRRSAFDLLHETRAAD